MGKKKLKRGGVGMKEQVTKLWIQKTKMEVEKSRLDEVRLAFMKEFQFEPDKVFFNSDSLATAKSEINIENETIEGRKIFWITFMVQETKEKEDKWDWDWNFRKEYNLYVWEKQYNNIRFKVSIMT